MAGTSLFTLVLLMVEATASTFSVLNITKSNPSLYAVAKLPTPVLNSPEFATVFGGQDGMTLQRDTDGLIRAVEFIALPGTLFTIADALQRGPLLIYHVTTDEYPYPAREGFFIDSRFVNITRIPERRKRTLPPQEAIIRNLLSAEGSRYIWGGNYKEGIRQLLTFYPPSLPLTPDVQELWELKGVDCSGLLYEATNGYTPRNTSALLTYGEPVKIAGLNSEQIMEKLEPLDLIVWEGHVIIVLDKERTIESRLDYDKTREGNQGGVKVRKLKEVLLETLEERIPVDHYDVTTPGSTKKFVIRRWYGNIKCDSLN